MAAAAATYKTTHQYRWLIYYRSRLVACVCCFLVLSVHSRARSFGTQIRINTHTNTQRSTLKIQRQCVNIYLRANEALQPQNSSTQYVIRCESTRAWLCLLVDSHRVSLHMRLCIRTSAFFMYSSTLTKIVMLRAV